MVNRLDGNIDLKKHQEIHKQKLIYFTISSGCNVFYDIRKPYLIVSNCKYYNYNYTGKGNSKK